VRGVERTGGTFQRPEDFSLGKILEGSFAVFEGGRARRVVLLFTGVAARLVAERVWHASQEFRRDKAGLVLTMKVGLSPDLKQWILGWGGEAEVLDPPELREALARAARDVAAVYRAS
jgi:predicted DNA-binding transcriptional regulator YafY